MATDPHVPSRAALEAARAAGLDLRADADGLALHAPGRRLRPLRVDLAAALVQHQPGAELLRSALRGTQRVMDLTAGLLGDALRLAVAGKTVLALERHPAVHALAADGLARLAATHPSLAARIRLECADAAALLARAGPEFRPDSALLDPMFPAGRAGAARRELTLLRNLVGDDPDAAALLDAARAAVAGRVAVKRPRLAPALAPGADFVLTGRSVRFDVYLTRR